MTAKVVKVVAVPVVLGIASVRVYAMNEVKTDGLLSPQELSIYSTEQQERLHCVEEQPGSLQSGLGKVRGSLQSYVQNIKSAFTSTKLTAVNLYHGGEDIYHFLKDPPSGFVPRASLITVSGLAGVILARKGSRLKRLALPLGLTSAGFAVCYPVQTISILKVSGKKVYAASQWTASTVASLWKSLAAIPSSSEEEQSSETVVKASSAQTKATEKNEAVQKGECSLEVPPPAESSSTHIHETQSPHIPLSTPVLAQYSETEHIVPFAEDGLKVMTHKEETSPPSSNRINENKSETVSLPNSTDVRTSTEKQHHGADLKLMDFGQSNPEDADLYSTRS
ncbi:MICOS complex subunit MIC27 [Hoplias malabaricus]|uniref:MICOS complex subunit MIC27 n=1 Tax=Hoplias malabaricus TaxID=27720 RepID=UPI00346197BD